MEMQKRIHLNPMMSDLNRGKLTTFAKYKLNKIQSGTFKFTET